MTENTTPDHTDEKKKGRGGRKLWLGAAVGLLLIGGCAALIPSGDSDPEGDKPAATSQEEKVKIGDQVAAGDWLIVVKSVGEPVAAVGDPEIFGADAQGHFVPVDVTVKNNGKSGDYFSADEIKVKDDQGREFSYSSDAAFAGDEEGGLILDQINPGNSVEGKLWFDTPTDAKVTEVNISSGAFSSPVVVPVP